MERILLTGSTGNVGREILKHLHPNKEQFLYVATRNHQSTTANELFFDLKDLDKCSATLQKIDTLFLLRPPEIADVPKYFAPIVDAAVKGSVSHIIFLSVQGAENISFIPHAKIEKLIIESGLKYTFIRPGYFMQNLTTNMLRDINEKNLIFLPAGKAKFLWVDVVDIGKAIATILSHTKEHINKAYTITGNELLNFDEVAAMLSVELKRDIKYISPNLIRFYFTKKKEGINPAFIMVMIMLHYLPRFQKPTQISNDFTLLTGDPPTKIISFIRENLDKWNSK